MPDLLTLPVPQDIANLNDTETHDLLQYLLSKVPPDAELAAVALASLMQRCQGQNAALWAQVGELIICSHLIDDPEWAETALAALVKSVEQEPEGDPQKYFYLGQLSNGNESYRWLETGRQLCLAAVERDPDSAEGKERLIEFLVKLVELHMTDLSDLPEARQRCEEYLNAASQANSASLPFIVQACAFFTIVGAYEEDKDAEAKRLALQGFEQLHTIIKRFTDQLECSAEEIDLPDYELQLELARLCTANEMPEQAEVLLNFLLEQNEEDTRVWHRLSLSAFLKGAWDESLEYLSRAEALLPEEMAEGEGEGEEVSMRAELAHLRKEIEKASVESIALHEMK